MAEYLLLVFAVYNLWFAWFHLTFWKRFRWDFDLRHSSDFSRSVIRVLNYSLVYGFVAVALVVGLFRVELVSAPLGQCSCAMMAGFWILRCIAQWVYLRSEIWQTLRWCGLFLFGAFLPGAALALSWWP